MKKRGMNLITLVITVAVVIGVMYISFQALYRTNLINAVGDNAVDMDMLNLQQLANIAYSNIYFENLRSGIRRELSSDEIRERMLKNGIGDIDINKYNITVKSGDVFVTIKEEE